ncbi:LacI family DNA-binding transcriptional regulator [Cryobacterium sp. TMS1-13-1]|uniref:LacI family DNA-binding transcriptional regulator n=1 Tax=Cryobacterium sp. TMS1-13-1 TaxID=1259220 RepID=UPI00106B08F1|nr:LacI family DNA-binding transcriptional regulator [Cryobacterium sp. TMS1-13-1]TFD20093.1 LacI family transcriptional regulator [Cryobacterium sp. TMS1-13-1]
MTQETFLNQGDGRATLAQIAHDASVSMSTVSKVLNARTGVSTATRVRVEDLLVSHGYNRRGSEQSNSTLIELVFNNIDSIWSLELIRGVERVARQNGLSVILTESGDRHSPSPDWIKGVLQRQPLGVILVFSDLSDDHKRQLNTRNIPFVVVDPAGDPAPDVPSIGSANWSGGLLATRHLIELGHRRIGIITGPEDMLCSLARLSGYRSALEAAGIQFDPALVAIGDFGRESGVARGHELLAQADRPTAIFASSDLQAIGLYAATRALGLQVPRDLSIVGYDDLPVASWVDPALTTVRQPLVEMAEEATRLVLKLRTNGHAENIRLDLAVNLVHRGSTAQLNG